MTTKACSLRDGVGIRVVAVGEFDIASDVGDKLVWTAGFQAPHPTTIFRRYDCFAVYTGAVPVDEVGWGGGGTAWIRKTMTKSNNGVVSEDIDGLQESENFRHDEDGYN